VVGQVLGTSGPALAVTFAIASVCAQRQRRAREFKRQLDKAEFERARTAKLQKEIEETARQIARRTASCARIPTGLRDPLSRPSFRRRSS
jgi:hypothetical protein